MLHPITEGLHMASKKRSDSAEKQLKATVKKLRSKLDRADAREERLRSKAARLEETATELEAQVKKLKKRNKRLEKTARPAERQKSAVTKEPSIVPEAATPPLATVDPSLADTSQPAAGPDASWTVVQLRAEARSRGLTGLSGKSKAQLLDALG